MTTLGILHPGSMGAAVAAQAAGAATVLWCPQGRSETTAGRAYRSHLAAVTSLQELADRCDVILSICPPAAAETVATSVADCRFSGIYVDANAIAPEKSASIAATLEHVGAVFVDGSVVGSPPSPTKSTRLYLAGPDSATAATADLFQGTQVVTHVLPGAVGSASALKLAYSSYQKASRALAAVAYALAAEHGVENDLLDIAQGRTTSYLAETDYFPKAAARAWRWAPEMHEVADALSARRLPPDLARAAEEVMSLWTEAKDESLTVSEALAMLRPVPPAT